MDIRLRESNCLRALVLYDWPEKFNVPAHPEFVVELVDDLAMHPTKASFFERIANKELAKETRRTLFKKTKLIDLMSSFPSCEGFELSAPIEKNFLNLLSDLQYEASNSDQKYLVALPPEKLPLEIAIRHIRLLCSRVSPSYGFSRTSPCPEVLFFAGGHSNVGRPKEENFRAAALGQSRVRTKQHLAGKILDVFELNVLSETHLQNRVRGQALKSWILTGNHGVLVEVNKKVSVWLVPEDIRQPIRARLWREGLFIDDSMPEIWKLDLSQIDPV